MVSTFHSYFDGRKDLFEGLGAGRLEEEWTKYPMFHFDMSMTKYQDVQGLRNMLGFMLSSYERKHAIRKVSDDENLRLTDLIRGCYAKYGQKVVILIDEYDSPLLDVLDNEDVLAANRTEHTILSYGQKPVADN